MTLRGREHTRDYWMEVAKLSKTQGVRFSDGTEQENLSKNINSIETIRI